jgi:nitrate/TMAO reductase-like tetraheme cytochrome c subunit
MGESERKAPVQSLIDRLLGTAGSLRRARIVRRTWASAAIVFVLVATGLGADFVTSSPRVCATCHEMRPKVLAWQQSPHAEIPCYRCHAPEEPWYKWPQAVRERGAALGRDWRAHRAGNFEDLLGASADATGTMPDSVCGRCHDPSRRPTPRLGILIDHPKHVKRNKSCVSCHFWTAHPEPGKTTAQSMMDRCFRCHGLSSQAKAPGTCTLCHDKQSDLLPASHKSSGWRKAHPKVALKDRRECDKCHGDNGCFKCHGVEMPHPYEWARAENTHAIVGARDRTLCARCHQGKPDLCTMCHHPGLDASKGPWVSQHFLMVRESGSERCMQCHDGAFCVDCHKKRGPTPAAQGL